MSELYLRDFAPDKPYPPGFRVSKERLEFFLTQPLKVVYLKRGGQTYVNYPELFGKEFRKVWFNTSLIGELENHHLYAVKLLLNQEYEALDFIFDCEGVRIYVDSVTPPLKLILPSSTDPWLKVK